MITRSERIVDICSISTICAFANSSRTIVTIWRDQHIFEGYEQKLKKYCIAVNIDSFVNNLKIVEFSIFYRFFEKNVFIKIPSFCDLSYHLYVCDL